MFTLHQGYIQVNTIHMFNPITACMYIYSNGTKSPPHGTYGPDTTFYSINLSDSERFFGAVVRYGEYVDQVTFISESASVPFNVLGPFGESTRRALLKNGAIFAAEIKGFYGHSGIGIHRLGFKGLLFT